MATRADFYVMKEPGKLEFVGSTSNEYDGDFEKATNLKAYLDGVNELLHNNQSLPKKWYWPWKTSHISDEVFVFKITPKLFNKYAGILLTKVYNKDCPETHLDFAKYTERYDKRFYNEETGEYHGSKVERYELPVFNQ